ncbi:MAG TPA: LysM peptidoglycan-binding domain-containing protein [Anaerolineae bacterium]|jgi:LysM repeat protein
MLRRKKPSRTPGAVLGAIVIGLVLIIVFSVTLVTAILLLAGGDLDFESVAALDRPAPARNLTPTVAPVPLVTPIAASMTTLRSVALGFAIDYPADWAKEERTLETVFSPAAAGLDPAAVLRVGIPANDNAEPESLLAELLADFPVNAQTLNTGTMSIAAQPWRSSQISFADEASGQTQIALLATTNRNDIGYLIVAAAPASEWPSLQPILQGMISSFRFTDELVIRPTDATPPPTPTPTPTPQVYVVQPGDTLSGIAVRFDVTIEALANRNGIDRPESLRSGQTLVIPNPRR